MKSVINVAYPLADHCNLNCRSCCRFCNSTQEKHLADLSVFERDMRRFKELVEHVEMSVFSVANRCCIQICINLFTLQENYIQKRKSIL